MANGTHRLLDAAVAIFAMRMVAFINQQIAGSCHTLCRHPEERPLGRVSKDGPQAPAAILRDARKGALLGMTARVWRR
jgi:hypothetical protein